MESVEKKMGYKRKAEDLELPDLELTESNSSTTSTDDSELKRQSPIKQMDVSGTFVRKILLIKNNNQSFFSIKLGFVRKLDDSEPITGSEFEKMNQKLETTQQHLDEIDLLCDDFQEQISKKEELKKGKREEMTKVKTEIDETQNQVELIQDKSDEINIQIEITEKLLAVSNTQKQILLDLLARIKNKQTALDHIDKICDKYKNQIENQGTLISNKEKQLNTLESEINHKHAQVGLLDTSIDEAVKNLKSIQTRTLGYKEQKQVLLKRLEDIDQAEDLDKKEMAKVENEIKIAQEQRQELLNEIAKKEDTLSESRSEFSLLPTYMSFYNEILNTRSKNNEL